MPWYPKEQPTPFDTTPIEGLWFLHGDMIASHYGQEHARDRKYPLISCPSGIQREIGAHGVHLFGTLRLPQSGGCLEAHNQLLRQAQDTDYQISALDDGKLSVINPYARCGYHIRYENDRLADIRRFPREAMELLPGEIRAALPPLYHNEQQGLDAIAPLKLFTPDSSWTWYASEFDGDDLLFGLVSGMEIELGYFSLSELEGVRGPLGLPVERDLYHHPVSLRELQDYEYRLRGG